LSCGRIDKIVLIIVIIIIIILKLCLDKIFEYAMRLILYFSPNHFVL